MEPYFRRWQSLKDSRLSLGRKANFDSFRTVTEELLMVQPYFPGVWISYAQITFREIGADSALTIYERALKQLPYSVPIWCSYLDLLLLCRPPPIIYEKFRDAIDAVGQQFYSHELWDRYLEFVDEAQRVEALQEILDCTIHQFARYYKMLEDQGFKHQRAKYERQQERVAEAWAYERYISRQTFEAEPLSSSESNAWLNYIANSPDHDRKKILYERAIMAGGEDLRIWMHYLRWLVAIEENPIPVMSRALPTSIDIRLYYALWLESEGQVAAALAVYRAFPVDAPASVYVQHAQFLARTGGDPVEFLNEALERSAKPEPPEDLVAELAQYSSSAFDDHVLDTHRFWVLFLHFAPERGDEIYERAPEIGEEYLAVLAKTNLKRYVEVDREINRSALTPIFIPE